MNIDFKKEFSNLKEIDFIKEALAKTYADILNIDEEIAHKILSAKFDRHIGVISDKFQKGITEKSVKNAKSNSEVNLEEYLEKKPVIKG